MPLKYLIDGTQKSVTCGYCEASTNLLSLFARFYRLNVALSQPHVLCGLSNSAFDLLLHDFMHWILAQTCRCISVPNKVDGQSIQNAQTPTPKI